MSFVLSMNFIHELPAKPKYKLCLYLRSRHFFLGLFHKAFHHLRTWLKHYDQLRVCSRPSPYHFLWAHCIMDRNSTYFQIFCYTTRFYGDNFPTFRTSPKPSLLWKPKKKNCPYGAWPPVWICEKNMSAKAANSFILLCNIWAFRFLFYFISFHLAFLLWFKKKKNRSDITHKLLSTVLVFLSLITLYTSSYASNYL